MEGGGGGGKWEGENRRRMRMIELPDYSNVLYEGLLLKTVWTHQLRQTTLALTGGYMYPIYMLSGGQPCQEDPVTKV